MSEGEDVEEGCAGGACEQAGLSTLFDDFDGDADAAGGDFAET